MTNSPQSKGFNYHFQAPVAAVRNVRHISIWGGRSSKVLSWSVFPFMRTMTMTMKNIYLTINQQIAKYSLKFLLL